MGKAQEVSDTVQALKKNASDLGLTWNLRLGTVAQAGVTPTIHLDGDINASAPAVPAISLIGAVSLSARVMTLAIPPHTLFVVGMPGGTVARQLTNDVTTLVTAADFALTGVNAQIPGLLSTVTVSGLATWNVTAFVEFRFTTAGVALATLFVDGVAMLSTIVFGNAGASARANVGNQWSGTFTAGGQHTFSLQAKLSGGAAFADSLNSTMRVQTYE